MGIERYQLERLRSILRDRRGQRSQETIASQLGMTKQALSGWERGPTDPGVDGLAAWAEAVGMRLRLDLYDPVDARVNAAVRSDLVETINRLHDLDESDLSLVVQLVLRLSRSPHGGQ